MVVDDSDDSYSGAVVQKGRRWLQCVSQRSGLPFWFLTSTLFLSIFFLIWLCCATATTATKQKSKVCVLYKMCDSQKYPYQPYGGFRKLQRGEGLKSDPTFKSIGGCKQKNQSEFGTSQEWSPRDCSLHCHYSVLNITNIFWRKVFLTFCSFQTISLLTSIFVWPFAASCSCSLITGQLFLSHFRICAHFYNLTVFFLLRLLLLENSCSWMMTAYWRKCH